MKVVVRHEGLEQGYHKKGPIRIHIGTEMVKLIVYKRHSEIKNIRGLG